MNWQIFTSWVILSVLTFLIPLPGLANEQEQLKRRLQEQRIISDTLKEENLQLKRQVAEQNKELSELRAKFAALLSETDSRIATLTQLELAAAELVHASEKPGDVNAAAALTEILALSRRRIQALSQALADHSKSINAILDACAPSAALRDEAEISLMTLQKGVERCLQPLTLATTQRSPQTMPAVISADKTTRIVLIDQGFLSGVKTGMVYEITREDKVIARLKVLICRPLIAAAEVTDGEFGAAVPGVLLQKGR